MLAIDDSASNQLVLIFDTPTAGSLVGFTGGPLLKTGANETSVMTSGLTPDFWDVTGSLAPVPVPAALPLFATGIGGLGLLGWRRKRKAETRLGEQAR